ncbi:hypothetical protein BDZ45DRAFT_714335 [Acephala macrosclerotiorum]|nr:hypothetical protein BDZ45DRAFT_714335 [Acephala macrosclerotiorum]
MALGLENSFSLRLPEKVQEFPEKDITESNTDIEDGQREATAFENEIRDQADATYSSIHPRTKRLKRARLLRQDIGNIRKRYISDWTLFNHDLYVLTGMTWGTIEVVFSTGFSIQPLPILGVTGPFSMLAENIYSLCIDSFHVDFLHVITWSLIHAAWMHYLLAICNAHDWTMQYVTTFSADIFSLLNSLQRNHTAVSFASFLCSVIGAVGIFLLAVVLSTANSWKPLFHCYIRMSLTEYASAISIILFIGIPHIGELAALDRQILQDRFLRPILEWIFLSIIPGAIITVLFYFDHEISSITCTLDHYGTKKPGGFARDTLLGITTAICGILGIPPAHGLLPQAPLHSKSLIHIKPNKSTNNAGPLSPSIRNPPLHLPTLQHILGLTPTSVLAGLFLFIGKKSLTVNPILSRFFYILTPPSELPLPKGVKNYWGILVIIALVPVWLGVMNRIWGRETLRFVDAWACKEGTPEDDEDRRNGILYG